jgi:hypothetical protein
VSVSSPLGDDGERLHDWMFVGRFAEQARAFEENVFAPCGARAADIVRQCLAAGIVEEFRLHLVPGAAALAVRRNGPGQTEAEGPAETLPTRPVRGYRRAL